jgi:hypothetical protein
MKFDRHNFEQIAKEKKFQRASSERMVYECVLLMLFARVCVIVCIVNVLGEGRKNGKKSKRKSQIDAESQREEKEKNIKQ